MEQPVLRPCNRSRKLSRTPKKGKLLFMKPWCTFQTICSSARQKKLGRRGGQQRRRTAVHGATYVYMIPGVRVPMTTGEEEDSWRKFKELDEGNHILRGLILDERGILGRKIIDLHHPIVSLFVRFSIKSYNAICEQAGKSNRVDFLDVVEVSYISVTSCYVFYITLEAMEGESSGVYEVKLTTDRDDGRKTLLTFVRTLRQPIGKKNETLYADLFDIESSSGMSEVKAEEAVQRKEVAARGLIWRGEQQGGFNYYNRVPGYNNFMY